LPSRHRQQADAGGCAIQDLSHYPEVDRRSHPIAQSGEKNRVRKMSVGSDLGFPALVPNASFPIEACW
jgi:hypothetical protein